MRCLLSIILVLFCLAPVRGQQRQSESLQLTLPPMVFAATGVPTSIYFDNIVLTQSPQNYRFQVACDLGDSLDRRWTLTPTDEDVGDHSLTVSVYNSDEQLLESKSCVLRVSAADTAESALPIRLLIIGDSLTHASAYPNEIARLLSRPNHPNWQMLGTHKPSSVADGVAHEGYGGWTWSRFVTQFEPNPDGTYRKRSSPFVFLNPAGMPHLDMPRYFRESCGNQLPDYVVIMLGINDCFSAPRDPLAAMDGHIDGMFDHANSLLAAIRQAAPDAQIGICLTTPPNDRQEAFQANYQDRYTRWGWKRIQHRLVQRQSEFVAAKADPQISIVPTQLNLDPIDGYPANNAVHPNGVGYQQVGATIYSWLLSSLSKLGTQPTSGIEEVLLLP